MFKNWLFRRFGVHGLVVIALLSVAGYILTHWDAVSKWHGIASVVIYLSRDPVPKADPKRFSILVAHLENDTNQESERFIVKELKEFRGIQALKLDRTISLDRPVPEEKEKQGYESAIDYLKESEASVLIWGTVYRGEGGILLNLYWSTSEKNRQNGQASYDAPTTLTHFHMPVVFSSDMAEILRLMIASRYVEGFSGGDILQVADRLSLFITRVQTLLEASTERPGWDANARGTTRVILAEALFTYGRQTGQNEPLKEAVSAYRGVIEELTRDDNQVLNNQINAVNVQINFGTTLMLLGDRESNPELLEEAASVYRGVIEKLSPDQDLRGLGVAQLTLGITLGLLGERENNPELLAEAVPICRKAVSAFRGAIEKLTPDHEPLEWARAQFGLGFALEALVAREQKAMVDVPWGKANLTVQLKKAVSAFREALEKLPPEQEPLERGAVQLCLGSVLEDLGWLEGDSKLLMEAVSVLRGAIEKLTPQGPPDIWDVAQFELGLALVRLALLEDDPKLFMEAVSVCKLALNITRPAYVTKISVVRQIKNVLQFAEAQLLRQLMVASLDGHIEVVQLLFANGADVNAKGNGGLTALMAASINGHIDIVQALIEKGADVNTQNCYGMTALMAASQNGHIEVVQALIDGGADVNAEDCNGGTALMVASQNGHVEVVRSLIDNDADVNAKNYDGVTALSIASQNGHPEVVKTLNEAVAKKGAD
jgi:tetratricopeptide (TPR) repeat protein